MAFESLRPVMYRGALVALAGRERFHLLAPWLADRSATDPELRLVAMLCLLERTVPMSVTTTYTPVVLEPASQAFVEATATPPFLYELTPDEARNVLDDVQAAPIDKLPVDERWIRPTSATSRCASCARPAPRARCR